MAQYTEYHPLKFWLDPASIAEIVAHIQTYLVNNPINSTTEIETIIHDYLIAHPELIGGVDSVNGQTGEVVLTADNISGGENVTIKDVLDSLQDQIDDIVASIPSDYQQLIDDVSDLKSAFDCVTTGETFSLDLGEWSQGGVNYQGDYSSWSRIRTDYIDLNGIGEINVIPASGYAFLFVVYDNSKTYTQTGGWFTEAQTININNNEKYIRLSLRKDPESNLSPSAGINVSATAVYKLPSNVALLTNAINKMQPVSIDDFLIWSIGGIADGANTNVTNKIRTGFFDVSDYSVVDVICQIGYKFSVTLYNASKEWLFSVPITGFSTEKKRILLGDQTKYIRLCMAATDDATQSDTSISSNLSCLGYKTLVGETLENSGKEIEISDGISWIRGTLDADGNYVTSTSRVVTDDYIPISNYQSVRVLPLSNTVKYNLIWYGSNGRIGSTNVVVGEEIYTVPANATRLKMILISEPEAWLGNANISNGIRIYAGQNSNEINDGNVSIMDYFVSTCVDKTAIPELATGTTILAIGDSITAAQDKTGWVYHIAQMTGVSVIDKAIGGSTFGESVSDQTHRINNQIATVTSEEWASANLVIVAAGTNDYQHETPLDELKEKVQSAVTAIKAQTNAPIVFITPIRRGLSKNTDIIQKIAMISGIIANVALANQCNVICGYDFPIPTYNINGLIDNMTRDALHPTATGANVYARAVINALK